MAASVQFRPQERTLRMAMKEVDEDLAMFLEMRNRESLNDGAKLDDRSELDLGSSLMTETSVTEVNGPADNWRNAYYDGSDYDWLHMPHGTRLSPSLEVEQRNSPEVHIEITTAQANTPKPKAASSLQESASTKSMNSPISTSVNSTTGNGRPSSSGGRKPNASRPATPTRRPSLPVVSKPARLSTPTSRASLPSAKTLAPPGRSALPASRTTTKTVAPPVGSSTPVKATARSSTPTARSSVAPPVRSSTPTRATARSSTPTERSSIAPPGRPSTPARATARASTPTGRSSVLASKPGSRSATPTRKLNSTATPALPTTLKNSVPPRGLSPTVKSRPTKPSEVPDLSVSCPNVKDFMTKRASSASRVRLTAPPAQASTTDRRKLKPQTPSSTGRTPNGSMYNTGSAVLSKSYRGHIQGDEVNPVIIGTKMVERVVNIRKLAPPKQNENLPTENSSKKVPSSQANPGFGRSLSKKSLDMAIRHMDITRSIGGNLRPLATSIAARPGYAKSKTASLTDSPLATSSNTSSEPSFSVPNGRQEDDIDMSSDQGNSPHP